MTDQTYMPTTTATRIDITPDAPLPLAGRGGRPGNVRGVKGNLEANVLCFAREGGGNVVLIAIDVLFSSVAFKDAVLARLRGAKHDRLELVFVASHTHHAPSIDPSKPVLGQVDNAYFQWAAERVAFAISEAIWKPGSTFVLKRGRGVSRRNASRRTPWWRVSPRAPYLSWGIASVPNRAPGVPVGIDVVMACDVENNPVWIIWSWPCHATAAPQDDLYISGDFPGEVRRNLREHLGNPELPVLYLPGFCGDLRADDQRWPPLLTHLVTFPGRRPFAKSTWSGFDRFCTRLSAEVAEAIATCTPSAQLTTVRFSRTAVPLTSIMDTQDARAIGIARIVGDGFEIVLVGAEVLSPYAVLFEAFTARDAILTGYADEVLCYLPVDRQIREGGYEAAGFWTSFGLQASYKQNVETIIADAARSLHDEVQTARTRP